MSPQLLDPLGFSVVMGLILVAGFLPCGLGLIVVMPALFLMQANAYRQISGGFGAQPLNSKATHVRTPLDRA